MRRDANITELPSHGRPLYGQAARNEVKRIRAWARRLRRYLGPITRRHFRDVMASIRPLRYDTWASAKEYLARCERERTAVLAAGQPWPPKGRSNTKPRISATPSSGTQAIAAPVGLRIQVTPAGPATAMTPSAPPPATPPSRPSLAVRMPGSGKSPTGGRW